MTSAFSSAGFSGSGFGEFERGKIAWGTLSYVEVACESMLEAITETDQILEALGILPLRVEPWERYYLLRPMVKERE
jgi:hypothetical protein